jgi:hypothetical protein
MKVELSKVAVAGVVVVLILSGTFVAGMAVAGVDLIPNQNSGEESTSQSQTENVEPVENPPQSVSKVKPQAQELLVQAQDSGYQNPSVQISPDGHILIEYDTRSTSETQLKNEIQQVSVIFANIDGEATSLTVVTGEIQAVVPVASVDNYRQGNMTDEAYKETIAYRNIEDSQED